MQTNSIFSLIQLLTCFYVTALRSSPSLLNYRNNVALGGQHHECQMTKLEKTRIKAAGACADRRHVVATFSLKLCDSRARLRQLPFQAFPLLLARLQLVLQPLNLGQDAAVFCSTLSLPARTEGKRTNESVW